MTKEEIKTYLIEHQEQIVFWCKLIGGGILAIFLSLLLFINSVSLGCFGKLPTTKQLTSINNLVASEIYSSDGVLLGKYYRENRTNSSLEAISPVVVDALIATEDARFYEHSGVDFLSLFRVFFKTILGGDESSGGGSTLSQQLTKNLYPRSNTLLVSKVKEMLTAKRLEKVYTKEELLTLYLNTVSFGEEVYGIGVASERYFNTSPDKLKTEQAAVLIGMLKATSYYNPRNFPERALTRRNVVLKQMLTYEKINQSTYDSLSQVPLDIDYNLISTNEGLAPYFREHLRAELKEWIATQKKPDGTAYDLYTDGLKIRTTIHSKMQAYAEEAVREHLTALQKSFDNHWKDGKPWGDDRVIDKAMKRTRRYKILKEEGKTDSQIKKNFNEPVSMSILDWEKGAVEKEMSPLDSLRYYYCLLNTGFLVMEPSTGAIRAWVGGSNYKYFKYDHVKSKRQVGSTFKPLVYATALQKGYQPCDYFYNRNTIYTDYDNWEPRNSDGVYGGLLSMEGGLMNSVNTITVDLIMRTGTRDVINLAQKMGIKSHIPDVPSIALGSADISLYEMLQVYGTLSNKGMHVKPKYLVSVEDANGNLIGEFLPKTEAEMAADTTRVLSEHEALIMTDILRSVVDSGTAKRLRWKYDFRNQIAGKTGTTQAQADGWFMGYTPNLVAGVWVGAEDPKVHFRDISLGQGANMALPIWAEFMKRVYKDPEFKSMEKDTFQTLPEEIAWNMECPPKITEEEYYYLQNQFVIQDTYITYDDSSSFDVQDIFDVPDRIFNEKPQRNTNRRTKEEARKEREKALKKANKARKRAERKKKRKKFFDNLFNRK